MSLQRRLTLFFILIVILPLTAAGLVVHQVVVGEVESRATSNLKPSLNAAAVRYNERAQVIDDLTVAAVGGSADFRRLLRSGDRAAIDGFLARRLDATEGLGFLIALDARGRLAGHARIVPDFAPGFAEPSVDAIIASRTAGPGFNRSPLIPVSVAGSGEIGSVIGGFWLDSSILKGTDQTEVDTFVVSNGEVIAGTREVTSVAVDVTREGLFPLELDGQGQARSLELPAGLQTLVAWTPDAPVAAVSRQVLGSMLALLALALIATTGLAFVLARLITRPLEELSEAAGALAEGRFDHRITVRSRDEVGQLARSFNQMSDQLSSTVSDLASSRDLLQRAVERVGETLRSTHDMKQILEAITNTAADAVEADAAGLWMFNQTRDELYPALASGMSTNELARIKVGEGIVGFVAERGVTVTIPSEGAGPRSGRAEPSFPVTIGIPLYSANRMRGVLTVYRNEGSRPFSRSDLDTVIFLAEQGGVAIENVLLHEEAQRLSLTDGLTGVWNRRYLAMQSRQVLATAARFERSFSILMLDLDHFKSINDTYGHQRGDDILVEFARRVGDSLREIDTLVRYGGEEFVALLSETDLSGARTTAEKVRAAVGAEPFRSAGETPVDLSVSIGLASYPDHGVQFDVLLEAADQALYRAKQEGRNRVCIAGSQPPDLHVAK